MLKILALVASMLSHQPVAKVQVQPCVWPNHCVAPVVAQFRPCVWPNTCGRSA